MTDPLVDQLLVRGGAAQGRVDGAAAMVRDLWLGGMPLPRAAAAAGVSVSAALETLRALGFGIARPERSPPQSSGVDPDSQKPTAAPQKRPGRRWTVQRAGVVRLYGEGNTIRAIAAELGMHQREVWRQLRLAGVPRRPRGTAGVVLSRSALERLYIRDRLSVAEVGRRFEGRPEAVVRNLERHRLPRRDRQAVARQRDGTVFPPV